MSGCPGCIADAVAAGFSAGCQACTHVILGITPVRYAGRDGEEWYFSCGGTDHDGLDDWGRAHTFHLLEADPSLRDLAGVVEPGRPAARLRVGSAWLQLIV